jgi:hypothetical protein
MRNSLHSICPYFAMFPETFAEKHIKRFTAEGEYVFDPFSGRGTTLFQSLLMGRPAIATDTNPVAFCVSGAKAKVPALSTVLREIRNLKQQYQEFPSTILKEERQSLSTFFRRAFFYSTLEQILFLRRVLDWRHSSVHRFVTAMALGSLHGEMDGSSSYFSNQMPRTISPKPTYSVDYWRRLSLWPEKRDVFEILRSRAAMRLKGNRPKLRGRVALLDARKAASAFPSLHGKVKAIITSPPYFDVTSYEEDQWLRLWFLGYQPRPTYGQLSRDDRHTGKRMYWKFLEEVWSGIKPLVQDNATLVCRIGAKGIEANEIRQHLLKTINSAFPDAYLATRPILSTLKKRQTDSFRPGSKGCLFEIDYVFCLGRQGHG